MRSTVTSSSCATLPSPIGSSALSLPTWYLGVGVCALADSERHLGHAIREGDIWVAYDAVHPNASHNGFLALGRFQDLSEATQAIESSVGVFESLQVHVAEQSKEYLM